MINISMERVPSYPDSRYVEISTEDGRLNQLIVVGLLDKNEIKELIADFENAVRDLSEVVDEEEYD